MGFSPVVIIRQKLFIEKLVEYYLHGVKEPVEAGQEFCVIVGGVHLLNMRVEGLVELAVLFFGVLS